MVPPTGPAVKANARKTRGIRKAFFRPAPPIFAPLAFSGARWLVHTYLSAALWWRSFRLPAPRARLGLSTPAGMPHGRGVPITYNNGRQNAKLGFEIYFREAKRRLGGRSLRRRMRFPYRSLD